MSSYIFDILSFEPDCIQMRKAQFENGENVTNRPPVLHENGKFLLAEYDNG